MKFPYKAQLAVNPITKEKDIIYRPFIPIDIGYNNQWITLITKAKYLDALIDSGSDNNLGEMDIARILNIPLEGITPHKVFGIDGVSIDVYYVPISINIGGIIYETHIGLANEITHILLGGQGFFNKWKVKLEYAKDIEILPPENNFKFFNPRLH